MLRRPKEPHPPGAAHGPHGAQAAGTNRGHPGRGPRGEGERLRRERLTMRTKRFLPSQKNNAEVMMVISVSYHTRGPSHTGLQDTAITAQRV